jgi:hypothetical protein
MVASTCNKINVADGTGHEPNDRACASASTTIGYDNPSVSSVL